MLDCIYYYHQLELSLLTGLEFATMTKISCFHLLSKTQKLNRLLLYLVAQPQGVFGPADFWKHKSNYLDALKCNKKIRLLLFSCNSFIKSGNKGDAFLRQKEKHPVSQDLSIQRTFLFWNENNKNLSQTSLCDLEGGLKMSLAAFCSVAKSCPILCDPVDCSMQSSLSFTISWVCSNAWPLAIIGAQEMSGDFKEEPVASLILNVSRCCYWVDLSELCTLFMISLVATLWCDASRHRLEYCHPEDLDCLSIYHITS